MRFILGYQILDPETGYVLPPTISEGHQQATTNFKRDTNTFRDVPEEIEFVEEHSTPQSYRQPVQHQQQTGVSFSRNLHKFPSIFDQFQNPFTGTESSPFSSSATSKRHTSNHQSFHEEHEEYPNR